jgi:hypothetical protein
MMEIACGSASAGSSLKMNDDIKATLELIEQRHPGCGWSLSKFHPNIKRFGYVSVQLFSDSFTVFEERQTFLTAAQIACERLDRRLAGNAEA